MINQTEAPPLSEWRELKNTLGAVAPKEIRLTIHGRHKRDMLDPVYVDGKPVADMAYLQVLADPATDTYTIILETSTQVVTLAGHVEITVDRVVSTEPIENMTLHQAMRKWLQRYLPQLGALARAASWDDLHRAIPAFLAGTAREV